MRIGVPKEIKNNENRVAITPAGVDHFIRAGHEVYIEKGAGEGSGFLDEDYKEFGASIVNSPKEAWAQEMVLKVKEPTAEEYRYFHEGLILFTYLHLAAERELTKQLIDKKVTAIAYETIQLTDGSLPLLTPMSEVAGKMATQIGAQFLEKTKGGRGILLNGIPGVPRGKVTIIGGGVVGENAAKIAIGFGANVTIIDLNAQRLRELDQQFGNEINTVISNPMNIKEAVKESDLVIGAVLIPGSKAPKLVSEEMVREMKVGSVIVDVAIDQGGIFETSDRMTTHDQPTYLKHGVVHYAVGNMPGAVPRTATIGLTNVTIPYALQIANDGYITACKKNKALLKGMNVDRGVITNKGVAQSLGFKYEPAVELLSHYV